MRILDLKFILSCIYTIHIFIAKVLSNLESLWQIIGEKSRKRLNSMLNGISGWKSSSAAKGGSKSHPRLEVVAVW